MASELAKAIRAEQRENGGCETFLLEAIDRVLAAHGITDDLMEQHATINRLLASLDGGAFKGPMADYVAAEKAANRWEE